MGRYTYILFLIGMLTATYAPTVSALNCPSWLTSLGTWFSPKKQKPLPPFTVDFRKGPYGEGLEEIAVLKTEDGHVLSEIKYIVYPNGLLEVLMMNTDPEFMNRKLSKVLVRAVMDRFPKVAQVKAGLVEDNADVVNRYLRVYGYSCLEAIRKSPFYKAFSAVGFDVLGLDTECSSRYHLAYLKRAI